MSSFSNCAQGLASCPPDPTKHVNFTEGMVLGVDDFQQEFGYLSGHLQWLARDALGYGTLAGLRLAVRSGSRGLEVAVSPGIALTPQGHLVHVCRSQCASLNDWLARGEVAAEAPRRLLSHGSPPADHLTVYVTLCYRECPTDQVPLAGEPCRDENELMAASRLQDDFTLELRFDPPDQSEESAVRELGIWFRAIPIVQGAGTPLPDFLNALRLALSPGAHSPPASPSSPPADLTIPADQRGAYLAAALRVWITEIRPERHAWFLAHQCGCDCTSPSSAEGSPPVPRGPEACLLLGELDLTLDAAGSVAAGEVREEQRPCLGHLRVLQELLFHGEGPREEDCGRPFASLWVQGPDSIIAWVHHRAALEILDPAAAISVVLDETTFSVSAVTILDGINNLFLIELVPGSPALSSTAGQRLSVHFDTTQFAEAGSPGGDTLAALLDQGAVCYAGREDAIITVHAFTPVRVLDDLADVETAGAGGDNALLKYDSATEVWRPGGLTLDELQDVNTASAGPEFILEFDNASGQWTAAEHSHELDDLTDVDTTATITPTPDARSRPMLMRDTDNVWKPAFHSHTLDDLSDVVVVGDPRDEVCRCLCFRPATRQWELRECESEESLITRTGVVGFREVRPGLAIISEEIEHGFINKELVMIRLALQSPNGEFDYSEDTMALNLETVLIGRDGFGDEIKDAAPRVVAKCPPRQLTFTILLKDTRSDPALPPVTYRVRWYAVPMVEGAEDDIKPVFWEELSSSIRARRSPPRRRTSKKSARAQA